jgi:hypothetical protein
MTFVPFARCRGAAVVTGAVVVALGAIPADAARLRARSEERADERATLVRVVGVPDLALSSSARWLRHPSQAEPGAAASEGPLSFDPDPAGALIAPPRALFGATGAEPR